MELRIKNPAKLELSNFCNYLISKMVTYISNAINDSQLIRFDKYINNNLKIKFIDKFFDISLIMSKETEHNCKILFIFL